MIKVHIVDYAGHGWILQKIANEVMELSYHRNLKMSRDNVPNLDADINYYINWVLFTKDRPKSNYDMIFFTHFENIPEEVPILNRADMIVAMSEHGKKLVKEKGVKTEVHALKAFGTNVSIKKKIRIGFSGRFYDSGRKGEKDLKRVFLHCSKLGFYAKDSQKVTFEAELASELDYFYKNL